ncbi:Ig-like domain-containing protein [Arthrobacter sp. NtRootA1]|uniref:Ig-like domain-containing protein n=1 Tax=Arthrobacter sp. NtRootA1 TaxID=2830983 RepID=UPI001CC4201F|nr:Ig-like domain-containing protein [Arthrobacter sp. NtRootA1]
MKNQLHLKSASLVAALLAVVVTAFGLAWSAGPANAAVIPGAAVTISTDSVVTNQWDQVDLTCQWSVPDNSQPGDTFNLQLPPELRWFGAASFDLDNADGVTVAKAAANDAGQVVFTLTDFVADHPNNVGGTCNFSTQYAVQPGTGETTEVNFTVGSTVVRVPVHVDGPCTQDCHPAAPTSAGKSMWWADAPQTELESIFYMPPMPSESNDVVVTDTPAAGMEIDCDHITPRVGRVVNSSGNITEPMDNELYPANVECTPQEATVRWTGLPRGERVELFVVTKVTDRKLDVYTNSGTVNIAGEETPVGAETRRTRADGTGEGTASPTATPTPTPSPSTGTPTATPTPTPSPSTSTATPTPTPSPSTSTATPTPTPSPSTSTATPTPTPSPSESTATPTPSPSESTATPSPSPSTTSPVLVATDEPTQPAEVPKPERLATTGAQSPVFVFAAAALLALGSLLGFLGVRRSARRQH